MTPLDLRDPERSDSDAVAEDVRARVSREPERPLRARVAPENTATLAALRQLGFVEDTEDEHGARGDEILLVLPPTLE